MTLVTALPEMLLWVLSRRMKLLAPGVLWDGLSPKGLLRGEYGLFHEPGGRLTTLSASGVPSRRNWLLGLRFSSVSGLLVAWNETLSGTGTRRPISSCRVPDWANSSLDSHTWPERPCSRMPSEGCG